MKKRILIVEDEKIIAEDIKQCLINFGYEVVGLAIRSDEAIRKAKDLKPDLVLVDIFLEEKHSGLVAAKEIYHKQHIPVIFLTAYSDDEVLEKATESIPYGYLIKPIDEKKLFATLRMTFYKIENEEKVFQDISARKQIKEKHRKRKKINEIFKAIKDKISFK